MKKFAPHRLVLTAVASAALAVSMSTVSLAASPSPSPSPCAAPSANYYEFSPIRLAAGDRVHVSGNVKDGCAQTQPSEPFTVFAQRPQDAQPVAVASTSSDSNGRFAVDVPVNETEDITVRRDNSRSWLVYVGRPGATTQRPEPVVTVDRVSGSCAGVVTLAPPSAVHLGDTVTLAGQRSDTSTVTIKIRRRATAAYAPLPTSAPDGSGRFAARYTANDDYAAYAAGQRCDSPVLIVRLKPTIGGPATARRGTSVPLKVTGQPGAPVAVYFHRAGSTGYAKRRAGTLSAGGVYTTSYAATADYRYYAVVGNDRRVSNTALTQAR